MRHFPYAFTILTCCKLQNNEINMILHLIGLIIGIEDRICSTDWINALKSLIQSNEEEGVLFKDNNIHILVKNLLKKYEDIGLKWQLVQWLYYLLNISEIWVFEEIYDENLIQVLTYIYVDPDCPKIINGDVDISVKPYIINILGNLADKIDSAADVIIKSDIF